jgi:hypothetical protein
MYAFYMHQSLAGVMEDPLQQHAGLEEEEARGFQCDQAWSGSINH